MSQYAWDEIITKLNKKAKENRLIKQALHKTYNTATHVLGKSKNKTLTIIPNDRTHNHKQSNQDSKSVRFRSRDQDTRSMTTPTHKAKSIKPILKSNTKMTTDDQQSVAMIREDTDSQHDTESYHAYNQSSNQEAIMDILCPDLNSDSDSNEDDSLFGTE